MNRLLTCALAVFMSSPTRAADDQFDRWNRPPVGMENTVDGVLVACRTAEAANALVEDLCGTLDHGVRFKVTGYAGPAMMILVEGEQTLYVPWEAIECCD